MGNGRSSGMASQRCHSFRAHSKIYPEKSGGFDVSCNASVSWRHSRDRLSSSADRHIRNNDSVVLSPKLCHCVQHCALAHLSFPDEEVLRTYWRIPDDTEGIGGQLPCAQCLRRFPRTSDSSNCLSLKTVYESHVSATGGHLAAEARTLAPLSGYWSGLPWSYSGSIADKAGRPVRSTVPNLNALIVSASSGSSPATSNNSAFAQHSYDSLEGRLWSWTASLSGFVSHTLFPRTHLL